MQNRKPLSVKSRPIMSCNSRRFIGIPTADAFVPRRHRAVEVLAYLIAVAVVAALGVFA